MAKEYPIISEPVDNLRDEISEIPKEHLTDDEKVYVLSILEEFRTTTEYHIEENQEE